MTRFRLGINNCFAVKRWPEPGRWAAVVTEELGLDLVQHSLDLVDLGLSPRALRRQAEQLRSATAAAGVELHSTFTGLAAYSGNLLLHPDASARRAAEAWFGRVIEFTASTGARRSGGHLGSLSVDDWADQRRRTELLKDLDAALERLAERACSAGIDTLYVENMACAREPSTMEAVQHLLRDRTRRRAAVRLCLDVGHMCVPGTAGDERDPYAWLRRFGADAPVVHLQQTDGRADHHWPFTARSRRGGVIEATAVLDAIRASGAAEADLLLEVIPPFEQDDREVLQDLVASVGYWKAALEESTRSQAAANPPRA